MQLEIVDQWSASIHLSAGQGQLWATGPRNFRDANHYSFCLIITHFGAANLHFCLAKAKEIRKIKQKFYKFFTIVSYIKHFLVVLQND